MTVDSRGDLAARIAADGYAVVPAVVPEDLVDRWCGALDEVFEHESVVAAERGWLTDAYRVSYALPAKDRVFADACTMPTFVSLAAEVLGEDCRVAGCNGLDMVAGGRPQRLHADHPVPTGGVTMYLHLVCALDAFTADNGGTRVVPRSHRRGPGAECSDEDPDATVALEVAPGGVVAFDASLRHAAGANLTSGPRRALHLFYGRSWVQPHWDFPASIPADLADALSPRQRRLLGYERGPARWDVASQRDLR